MEDSWLKQTRVPERYAKNRSMLTEEEILLLNQKKVCIVGCGGLGGYLLEMLGRLGVERITVIDGDTFSESNLNRQLLATEQLVGMPKARVAAWRMITVNSRVKVVAHENYLSADNARAVLEGHDLVFDALDSIRMRKLVARTLAKLGIPLVHGAIAGWYGQVATIFPGEDTLERIYPRGQDLGEESVLGNPSFTPALVASLQVSEGLKLLLGRGDLLRGKLLVIDLLNNDFETIPLGD